MMEKGGGICAVSFFAQGIIVNICAVIDPWGTINALIKVVLDVCDVYAEFQPP